LSGDDAEVEATRLAFSLTLVSESRRESEAIGTAMKIGELARRTGVSPRMLRYYEHQGLLQPQRRPSGYREYSDADVAVVRRVRQLLKAGLSTQTIIMVLPCVRDDGERLVPTCSDLVAELRAEQRRIESTIDDLTASRDALRAVIDAADVTAGIGSTS
jgi:DNA-binding transcriptional MerR regulator